MDLLIPKADVRQPVSFNSFINVFSKVILHFAREGEVLCVTGRHGKYGVAGRQLHGEMAYSCVTLEMLAGEQAVQAELTSKPREQETDTLVSKQVAISQESSGNR